MPQAKFHWPLFLKIMCTLNVILSKSSIEGCFHEPTKYANKKEKVRREVNANEDKGLVTNYGEGGGHVKFYP